MYRFVEDLENLQAYTNIHHEMLDDAALDCGDTTYRSLKRQFIHKDEFNSNTVLRLSALGKPAMELVCQQFMPLTEDVISSRLRTIFFQGDAFEGLFNFLCCYMGYTVKSTQDVVEWNGVKGHTDGVVTCPHTNQDWLVELKTMNDKKFKMISKQGYMHIPEYVTQMATYKAATGLPGIWVCYNKNTSEIMTILPTEEQERESLRRAEQLVKHFVLIEKFEDAFNYFRTPPIDTSGRYWKVPDSMMYSSYADVLYHIKPSKVSWCKNVEFPYYNSAPQEKIQQWIEYLR